MRTLLHQLLPLYPQPSSEKAHPSLNQTQTPIARCAASILFLLEKEIFLYQPAIWPPHYCTETCLTKVTTNCLVAKSDGCFVLLLSFLGHVDNGALLAICFLMMLACLMAVRLHG